MKNKSKTLIIDGNNLIHRCYHQFKSMRTTKGTLTSIIFGTPYVLRSLIVTHRPTRVCVVFDGSRSKRRLEILPGYKDRVRRDDFDSNNFYEQKETTQKLLKYLGLDVFIHPTEEADDIIYLLARKHSRKGPVVIVSADKDFDQLINKRISIWNPHKKERITHQNCLKLKGYTPEQCVDYLSLLGDKSDCIPGYKGVGEKTALKFLNEVGSIYNFLNNKSIKFRIDREVLAELYKINRELIDIKYFVRKNRIKLKDTNITRGKFNEKEVRFICADYEINTIQSKDVLKIFKRLYDGERN